MRISRGLWGHSRFPTAPGFGICFCCMRDGISDQRTVFFGQAFLFSSQRVTRLVAWASNDGKLRRDITSHFRPETAKAAPSPHNIAMFLLLLNQMAFNSDKSCPITSTNLVRSKHVAIIALPFTKSPACLADRVPQGTKLIMELQCTERAFDLCCHECSTWEKHQVRVMPTVGTIDRVLRKQQFRNKFPKQTLKRGYVCRTLLREAGENVWGRGRSTKHTKCTRSTELVLHIALRSHLQTPIELFSDSSLRRTSPSTSTSGSTGTTRAWPSAARSRRNSASPTRCSRRSGGQTPFLRTPRTRASTSPPPRTRSSGSSRMETCCTASGQTTRTRLTSKSQHHTQIQRFPHRSDINFVTFETQTTPFCALNQPPTI